MNFWACERTCSKLLEGIFSAIFFQLVPYSSKTKLWIKYVEQRDHIILWPTCPPVSILLSRVTRLKVAFVAIEFEHFVNRMIDCSTEWTTLIFIFDLSLTIMINLFKIYYILVWPKNWSEILKEQKILSSPWLLFICKYNLNIEAKFCVLKPKYFFNKSIKLLSNSQTPINMRDSI